jgi:anthranilate synthase/aminodeoxychorismate synthase-like glutamine amidotransferase
MIRNDEDLVFHIDTKKPSHIVIGPGPGNPKQLPQLQSLILRYAGKIPILGVCLGHQCIAYAYGAKIVRAIVPVHGKGESFIHQNTSLFQGMPNPCRVGRYHSLVVEPGTLPISLEILAETASHEIMALRHTTLPIYGVQFHPESILTTNGSLLIKNFLSEEMS